MDPEALERQQPAETSTVVIPEDVINEILYHIVPDPDFRPFLRSCSLVSKSWVVPSQRHLFHTLHFTGRDMFNWIKTFPAPEMAPAHHVRDLRLSLGGQHDAPDEFFERIRWFTGVQRLTILGRDTIHSALGIYAPGRYPKSVASLISNTTTVTVLQIRDVVAQLQHLTDLALSGSLGTMNRSSLGGIGTILKGEFSGKLRLLKMPADDLKDVISLLLEVPAGLRFIELEVHSVRGCLLPVVRLAGACGGSLVKLSYTVDDHDGLDASHHSFDFAKLPNLKEAKFTVNWFAGSLLWTATALSSLKPATSPRLSIVRLNFHGMSQAATSRKWWKPVREDFLRVRDEVARIEREFVGAVNLIVSRPPGLEAYY